MRCLATLVTVQPMPKLAGGRIRARKAIERVLVERGLSLDHLGRDYTRRFLSGEHWPIDGEFNAIEDHIGWPYGTIREIVARPSPAALSGTEHALVNLIHEMPEQDRQALLELLKVRRVARRYEAEQQDDLIAGELAEA